MTQEDTPLVGFHEGHVDASCVLRLGVFVAKYKRLRNYLFLISRIFDLDQLKFVYPNIKKENAFGKFRSQDCKQNFLIFKC